MSLAKRTTKIKPSATLEITAKAGALKAQGIDVINFAAGEPDFDTPENIKEAAIRAIKNGFTKYTPVGGIAPLKEAIINKLKKENGLEYTPAEIIVSCGAKHSLYNISQALFEEGDEIIIPSPYWVSYPEQVLLSGAKPVIVETTKEEGYILTPENFKKAITAQTKAIIINSPSNPTGASYSRKDLEQIAQIALEKNLYIISDEIYEKLIYDNFTHVSIGSISKEVKANTIIVNGLSKAYAMTGWRLGYAAGPEKIVKAMTMIQSQSTSNSTSIAQYAAVEALNGPQEGMHKMVAEFSRRMDYICQRFSELKGVAVFRPRGSFYVFPDFSGIYGRKIGEKLIKGSLDLGNYLLEQAHIAAVPGIEFGHDQNIRISFATSMKMIEEGMNRIKKII